MRPSPGNGASIRRAGCSCSCRTRGSDRSRWCLRFSSRRGFPAQALRLQDYLGALILFVGIAGEALADAQLKRFRDRPRQQGPGLRRRAVALVAPSELFLRMVRLAGLSRDRDLAGLSVTGAGRRCWRRSSCTGSWCTSPASRRWKQQMLRSRGERYRDYQSRTSSSFRCRPQQGSRSHEPVVSSMIGTAERVPLPDVIIRAAIQRLCSRTATRLAIGNADERCRVRRRNGGARHRRTYRRGQCPALRSAGGVLCRRCSARTANIRPASTGSRHSTLQEAEEEALRQTVEHADLADGQSILELGCGWGSLSLWMARQFPNAQDHRGVEFAFAARIYRERGGGARA